MYNTKVDVIFVSIARIQSRTEPRPIYVSLSHKTNLFSKEIYELNILGCKYTPANFLWIFISFSSLAAAQSSDSLGHEQTIQADVNVMPAIFCILILSALGQLWTHVMKCVFVLLASGQIIMDVHAHYMNVIVLNRVVEWNNNYGIFLVLRIFAVLAWHGTASRFNINCSWSSMENK